MRRVFDEIDDIEINRHGTNKDDDTINKSSQKLGSNAHHHRGCHGESLGSMGDEMKHWTPLHGFSDTPVCTPVFSHSTLGSCSSIGKEDFQKAFALPSLQSQVQLAFTNLLKEYTTTDMKHGRNIFKVPHVLQENHHDKYGNQYGQRNGTGTTNIKERHLSYQLTLNFNAGTVSVSCYDKYSRQEMKSPKIKMLTGVQQSHFARCGGKNHRSAHRNLMNLLQEIETMNKRIKDMEFYMNNGHSHEGGSDRAQVVGEQEESKVFVMERR